MLVESLSALEQLVDRVGESDKRVHNTRHDHGVQSSLAMVRACSVVAYKVADEIWHVPLRVCVSFSPWTVKTELGHGSLSQIEQTYGHLLDVRHRLDRVEYRALKVVEGVKTA